MVQSANFFYDAASKRREQLSTLGPDVFDGFVIKFQNAHPGDADKPISEQALNSISVGGLFDMYGSAEGRETWMAQLGYDNMWQASAAVWSAENKLLAHEETMYLSKCGWQSVVRRLAQNTEISYGDALTSFHVNEQDKSVCLRFGNGRMVEARSIFITIPSLQLKRISGFPQSVVGTVENSMVPITAAKVFLSWHSPWWTKDFGITGGHSITTLRTRMIYYWDETTILIYTAGPDGASSELASLYEHGGKQAVVDAVVDDLSLAHYGEIGRIPQPQDVRFHAWPFAVSLWTKDVNIPAVKAEIMQPLGSSAPVWCASSCSSDSQGWMEGALESSKLALKSFRKHLGVTSSIY
jgi:hypothetical protein